MLQTSIHPLVLNFIRPSGTSRGVMHHKKSWLIQLFDTETKQTGWGECSVIEGLSPDYENDEQYAEKITQTLLRLQNNDIDIASLKAFPSIQFGVETALKSVQSQNPFLLFDTAFSCGGTGIAINGLIWMGDVDFMLEQIEEKINAGFHCLKLKIGAIHFDDELNIIRSIRQKFSSETLEIRVDANGAFQFKDAYKKLDQLSKFELHSIEQPIKAGNWKKMAELCKNTPIPIALDEELIGIFAFEEKKALLYSILPQFIILKPSLVGGFSGTDEWIDLAKQNNIPWWATSALESNIGLNAIAQFTSTFQLQMPQGLGTGSLYQNNISSPLTVVGEELFYQKGKNWDLSLFNTSKP